MAETEDMAGTAETEGITNTDTTATLSQELIGDYFKEPCVSSQPNVPAMVKSIHQSLVSHATVGVRLRTDIWRLAGEHPADVVLTLLRCAPTCDSLLELLGDADGEVVGMSLHVFTNVLQDQDILISSTTALKLAQALLAFFDNMFFFLLNLALTDLGSICTTVPKAMHNSLWHTNNISYSACAAQVFFFLFFISAELSLLTIMCYDRYVSICKPLHYGTLLGSRACAHMAAAAWASAFLYSLLHTANTFSLPLCHGNALGQFFCEIPQILKLSCSHSYLRELGLIAVSVCLAFGCFVFIVFSYVQIFRAVLRIPSEQGRHKAFSTCLPHLAVVSLFITTGTVTYLKPPSISSPSLDLALSVLYSVVPPALNPLIYSLRNQELKAALCKLMTQGFQKH
ncbi:olfactory receptor 14J1-like [Cinclus cinclus]|uniref:olfactory receptor 14J1-like n=1 Tax=Cinclus cinclus TaxID=127875 RepID=UPI002E104A02